MPQPSAPQVRIGTRSSQLARWQAEWVKAELESHGAAVELVFIQTSGDQSALQNTPIQPSSSPANESLGGLTGQPTGVFTKAIQDALLAGEVDIAVHSLKDLPTEPVSGLQLTATPLRAQVTDAFLSVKHQSLLALPRGASVGTGSLRRQAQLLHLRSDLDVQPIRGNLDTRLQKLDDGLYDAIVLATAGLDRLGWSKRITETLPAELMLPAVGQGSLGIETRKDDSQTIAVVEQLNHLPTLIAVTAERTLLRELRGGCLAPIGVLTTFRGNLFQLTAAVLSADGCQRISTTLADTIKLPDALSNADELDSATTSSVLTQAVEIGVQVAKQLHGLGAAALIATSRGENSPTR